MRTSTYPNKEVNDHNINAEIVQVSATQKLVVFLEHKEIGATRRKAEQVSICRHG